jgi:hypothetical protein
MAKSRSNKGPRLHSARIYQLPLERWEAGYFREHMRITRGNGASNNKVPACRLRRPRAERHIARALLHFTVSLRPRGVASICLYPAPLCRKDVDPAARVAHSKRSTRTTTAYLV